MRIAFIGLGRMGIGMAGRLLGGDHELRVFNRTALRAEQLAARGARAFATPREASDGAEAIVAMVADDEASRAIWHGPDGALAAKLVPGALAIECSTLSHDWVLELAASASDKGLRYVDAPVTGLPEAAAAGELTLLVGATPDHLEAARHALARFSQRILHFGPVGAGTAYKLFVNMLGAVQIASAAETMALAERAGLDLALVAEALSTGQAASPQVIRNAQRISRGRHEENVIFTPRLRLKDVDYALRLARKLGIGSPFGALSAHLYRKLLALGPENINESKIIEIARAQTPER
jgi:3-hydroxyisobutyrate dehydrogenase